MLCQLLFYARFSFSDLSYVFGIIFPHQNILRYTILDFEIDFWLKYKKAKRQMYSLAQLPREPSKGEHLSVQALPHNTQYMKAAC